MTIKTACVFFNQFTRYYTVEFYLIIDGDVNRMKDRIRLLQVEAEDRVYHGDVHRHRDVVGAARVQRKDWNRLLRGAVQQGRGMDWRGTWRRAQFDLGLLLVLQIKDRRGVGTRPWLVGVLEPWRCVALRVGHRQRIQVQTHAAVRTNAYPSGRALVFVKWRVLQREALPEAQNNQ